MVIKLQAGAFYGSTMRSLTLAGFSFTEKSYEPQKILPRHSHELAHFCFVLEGSYNERLGSASAERIPQALVFYPSDITHAEIHHTEGRHFLIELDAGRTTCMRDYGLFMNEPAFLSNIPNQTAAKLYREFRHRDELSGLALEALALELMVESLRSRDRHMERQAPKWLDQVKEILRCDFAEPPALNQLAQAVGIHPVHLIRVFRKFERCTISEYVRLLRIEHARRKIISSDEPFVDIALSTGFADQTHFSRSFKRVTGMTPSEFRKTARR